MQEKETRSLWEVYASETEPWRRGRRILLCLGLFYFVLQSLIIASAVLLGNLEQLLVFGLGVVLFWLQFYFVWIGVHWMRWLWGGWNLILGFCMLIWAWRDESGLETLAACMSLLIGSCLCLSPAIYFFALRQREFVRWKESLLVASVCVLMLISIGVGIFGIGLYREQRKRETADFAEEVAQRLYNEQDEAWIQAHVIENPLREHGRERGYIFSETGTFTAHAIRPVKIDVRFYFKWPATIETEAHVTSNAETTIGPVELHNILWDLGTGWRIEHTGWKFVPLTEPWPLPSATPE